MDADAGRRMNATDTPAARKGKSLMAIAAAAAGLGAVADGIRMVKDSVIAAMDPPKPARKRAPVWAGYAPIGTTPITHARGKGPVVITVATHIEHGKSYPYASPRQNTRTKWRYERDMANLGFPVLASAA